MRRQIRFKAIIRKPSKPIPRPQISQIISLIEDNHLMIKQIADLFGVTVQAVYKIRGMYFTEVWVRNARRVSDTEIVRGNLFSHVPKYQKKI